ncbi:DUF5590 domain-containing protein [Sporosarcina luteola]|uniref:cell wall elongation regulator TseB-like domain-containing protein n=1 Tax=Sporosarcina luteola TaxID=582850 RepID=UPI00203CD243|nr:DUF5590 domain-containing protein [Sporosarcina luteola]MCM3709750.1 DUF5590 domain-containing protein [Sporosarcina luteola]
MMNWIKFIAAFLLALSLIIIVIVFYNANTPFSNAKEQAEEDALKYGALSSVDRTTIYNGAVSMVTVFGKDDKDNEKAVFIEGKTGEILDEVVLKDGIDAQAAIETVKAELPVEKILHVVLGLEEGHPVWEVAFKGENGKLNYVYVFFENGEWWKRILNL